ncbi:MAG: 50S ribosomal protein L31e [Candidatus Thermoplasmatota archaeon]|jgi:large subunit ribosomal protein L31e|nr:50S ribosomal protein L31e [Candidatus Thermoplasmatota archaeon]
MADETTTEIMMNIPLRKAFLSSKKRRADTAMTIVKQHVSRFTKTEIDKVWVDGKINEEIWKRGKYKIPGTVRVKILKLQNGETEVLMPTND